MRWLRFEGSTIELDVYVLLCIMLQKGLRKTKPVDISDANVMISVSDSDDCVRSPILVLIAFLLNNEEFGRLPGSLTNPPSSCVHSSC